MSKQAEVFIEKYTTKDQNDWLVEKKDVIAIFMECYHNQQLQIGGVSKCADEVIKYIENDAEINMPINELMHEDGSQLTKKEFGQVLLKYLILELKERFC